MLKLRSNKIVLPVAALLLVVTSAFAQMPEMKQDRGEKPCMREGQREHRMMMIPDLNEKQQEQIKQLRVEHMKAMQPLGNQSAEKKARLRTLTTADKVDMAEVNKVIDEIGKMQTQMMKQKEQHRQDVRNLLTEEQRLFFDSHQPMHHEGPQNKAMPHKK